MKGTPKMYIFGTLDHQSKEGISQVENSRDQAVQRKKTTGRNILITSRTSDKKNCQNTIFRNKLPMATYQQ